MEHPLILLCVCCEFSLIIELLYLNQTFTDCEISLHDTLKWWFKNSENLYTLPYIWKNERHLCLVIYTFTKLLQNGCLINIHILMYWYARCNCKLWKVPWFYCIFFMHYWRQFMSELLYLHQTFTDCLSNQYTNFNILTWQM